jgi:truncated hemoglobin YjbI
MVELDISLYDKLGGEEIVDKLVERMYTKILADPVLNIYFYMSDIKFLKKQFFQNILL